MILNLEERFHHAKASESQYLLPDLPEVSFCFVARLNALQPGSGLRHLVLQVRPDFLEGLSIDLSGD